MKQDSREIHAIADKKALDNFMSEAEQIHYFGLCKPDHSDCPYKHCGIRGGLLPPQRNERKAPKRRRWEFWK